MNIIVHEKDDCAWCELPDGRTMYGKSVSEVCETLDELFKNASESSNIVKLGDKQELSGLRYNR